MSRGWNTGKSETRARGIRIRTSGCLLVDSGATCFSFTGRRTTPCHVVILQHLGLELLLGLSVMNINVKSQRYSRTSDHCRQGCQHLNFDAWGSSGSQHANTWKRDSGGLTDLNNLLSLLTIDFKKEFDAGRELCRDVCSPVTKSSVEYLW